MSHSIAGSQPPPSAWPWTEAITGFFMSQGINFERQAFAQVLMPFQRVVLPRLVRIAAGDVVADAEAAALGVVMNHWM